MSEWIEIVVPAAVASADDVAALLASEVEAARAGTEIRGSDVVFWTPPGKSDEALAGARSAAERMAAMGMEVHPARIMARPATPEAEWRDAWKRYFHITRVTRQITVVPSWEAHAPEPDELAIHLDPGLAFGTGAHASTRLVLEELQGLADRGAAVTRFLDAGTGSGILAIGAARLFPRAVGLAVDIDPQAVAAAAENFERNQVNDRVRCAPTAVRDIGEIFDLVVANIEASVLLDLLDTLASRVAPGGQLILSGLLVAQAEGVASAYRDRAGLAISSIRRSTGDPEWASAALFRAPAGPAG